MIAVDGGSRISAADVEAMANAMAAQVDARLRGESPAPVSPVAAEPPAPPAPVVRETHGARLTEDQIQALLFALGDDLRPHAEIAREFNMTPNEVRVWCSMFMKSLHAQGWPRIRGKIDAKKLLFASGIDLEDYVDGQRASLTPTWRKSWRALWFLLRLYSHPSQCREWLDSDPLGLFPSLRVSR